MVAHKIIVSALGLHFGLGLGPGLVNMIREPTTKIYQEAHILCTGQGLTISTVYVVGKIFLT